jgi:hypothetical protein
MNFKRFMLVIGVLVLAVTVGLFWGCQQNQPTATEEKVTLRQGAETCEQYGTISVSGGEYIIQNNVWGANTRQCVESTGGTGFIVSVSEHNQGSVAGYPSIFKGCHWDVCTNNKGGGPIRVSDCRSAPFSFSVSSYRPSGNYNVAAEAWLNPSTDCSGGYSGGAEIMIVLDYHGMYPAGSQVGTFNGHDVYYTNVGWEFVTYVITGRNSASGDMMDFINDAASRGYVNRSWYIHDMEAGFEIMSGGQGLECLSFAFSMSGNGGTTTTTSATTSTTTTAATTSTTTTSATTTTTAGGNCDCGTCNWYGSNVPACCTQTTGWGWQDGGCNRTCVGCETCINAGQTCTNCTQCGGATTTTTTAATTSTTTTSATTSTTTTAATTSTTTTAATTTTTSGTGETCSPVDAEISASFTQNGAGEYCWTATSCNYINSWNLSSLTINGENFTNKWASGSNLPAKIDGKWYIHYEGNYGWSHFELR